MWVLRNHTAPYIRQKQGFHTVFRPQNHTHHTQTARPNVGFSAQRNEKHPTPTQRKTKNHLPINKYVPSFNHTYLQYFKISHIIKKLCKNATKKHPKHLLNSKIIYTFAIAKGIFS